MLFQITDNKAKSSEYKLTDIIFLKIYAVLSGQDDRKAIFLYGEAKLEFLKRFGDFSHDAPSTSTIASVVVNKFRTLT
ncbi:transposase family protein [Vibrio sp. SCSIO 43140]|uniref:transposase family protein n=1 Tax=Vibrio sp. SCSIO 43140 TaxID=2819100 RepID=UPI00218A2737|nr:transposase family protein [Vibrio sp. SCSIO 43140]